MALQIQVDGENVKKVDVPVNQLRIYGDGNITTVTVRPGVSTLNIEVVPVDLRNNPIDVPVVPPDESTDESTDESKKLQTKKTTRKR